MEITSRSLQGYAEIIDSNPLLSREEEFNLVSTMNKFENGAKKQEAREKLFKANLRLVFQQAQIFKKITNLPLEDLVGEGIEGLGLAIDRFNPEKYNTKLSTFSMFWIRLKLFQSVTRFNHIVYIPRHIIEKSKRLRDITDGDVDKMTDKEIMNNLEVSELVLKNIQAVKTANVVSLDSECYKDSDDSSSLGEVIADKNAVMADKICAERERKKIVKEYLNQLDPVAKDILCCRYMNDTKEDLREIGKRLNLTGERIRQIEFGAFRKLRKRMRNISFFQV